MDKKYFMLKALKGPGLSVKDKLPEGPTPKAHARAGSFNNRIALATF